jgi:uncharacterized protein
VPVPAGLQDETLVHIFYLHGFASSPQSGKAAFLRDRLAPMELPLHVPDFNQPDFATLTVSRMLRQVDDAIGSLEPGPVALIGSSLGGFVAIHAAARQAPDTGRPITRLVLLAPAVDFCSGRDGWLSDAEIEEWRRTDRREVFHYAENRPYPMRFALYEDGHGYDAFSARVDVPVLAFQGTRDTVVRPASVQAWAASRHNVALRLIDDDHQLQGSLEEIWCEISEFLDLRGV